jgi:hypothetical protein
MSDTQRPPVLTLLAILALITGVFSVIRGGLLIFGGISQVMDGVGGIFEIIIGVLDLAVGALAIISGIKVLLNKAGGVALMWKFAIALIGYNVIWVLYASVAGGTVSWLSVLCELAICIVTLGLIKTSEEIKAYLESVQ